MPLQPHVVSHPLALALRDVGYPQDVSLFCWVEINGEWRLELRESIKFRSEDPNPNNADAPLASELGEMLPTEYHSYRVGQIWFCVTYLGRMMKHIKSGESGTEADARAAMFLHLRKASLI